MFHCLTSVKENLSIAHSVHQTYLSQPLLHSQENIHASLSNGYNVLFVLKQTHLKQESKFCTFYVDENKSIA